MTDPISENSFPASDRLNYLDSIRGLAALMVVFFHLNLMTSATFPPSPPDWSEAAASISGLLLYVLSLFLEAGRSAVMIFFVLSGFVLAHSLLKRPVPYGGFVVKRFFRIYPAFLVAVLASYALHLSIGVRHGVQTPWLWGEIHPALSFQMLLKNLSLWSTPGSNGLDRVMWSLVHEMRVSLIFPIVLFTVVRFGLRSLVAYGLLSLACTLWLLQITGTVVLGYEETSFPLTFLDTGYYIVFFACGAYLAVMRAKLTAFVAAMPKTVVAAIGLLVIYCLLKPEYDLHDWAGGMNDYIRGAGAIGLIVLTISFAWMRSVLSHRLPVWLGRISYSLYLVHCPILYVVSQTIGASWAVFETGAAVLALSLLTAEVMTRCIEHPSIRLGKFFARSVAVQPA